MQDGQRERRIRILWRWCRQHNEQNSASVLEMQRRVQHSLTDLSYTVRVLASDPGSGNIYARSEAIHTKASC